MENRQMSNTGFQIAEVLKHMKEKIFCTEQDKRAYDIMNEKLDQDSYWQTPIVNGLNIIEREKILFSDNPLETLKTILSWIK